MDMREMMRCSRRVDPEPDLPMHFSFRCGITVVSKVVKPYLVSASDRRQGARGTRIGSDARMGLDERMSSPRTAMASQPC